MPWHSFTTFSRGEPCLARLRLVARHPQSWKVPARSNPKLQAQLCLRKPPAWNQMPCRSCLAPLESQ